MLSKYLQRAVFAASVIGIATAQKSDIVPEELQGAFTSGEEVQVSYTGDAVNGFADGTTFEKDAVANVPEFALGDSSGVSPTRRYTILMVDTTCDTRVLHYARTNFKYNFDIVNIESETDPVLAYKAPGSFSETGDDRKYSFLMYGQPENDEISDLKLPGEGEPFDFGQFQDDNGFEDPKAGVGMIVKLGGQSNCGSGGSPAPEEPQSSSAPEPSSSAEEEPSQTPTRTAPSQATSVVPTATDEADTVLTTGGSSATATDDNESPASTAPATGPTTDLAPASSAVPSTLVLSSAVSDATASETTTGGPAQQTTSGAQALSWHSASFAMAGSIFAFAGLFV